MCKNSKTKNISAHRLVAEAFIPNPNNYKIVNHKDEDKQNNSVDNLEWCSQEYNTKYSYKNGTNQFGKKVAQYDLNGNFIKEYSSTRIAEVETGFSHAGIAACCRGKYKTSHNYIWKYIK